MEHQTIFAVKDLKRRVNNFLTEKISNRNDKINIIENWQKNITSGKILKQKEEELQSLFLHTFFGDVLNYEYKNPKKWNLRVEVKTEFDATKADGALGFFEIDIDKNINSTVKAVIELKDARTPLDKPQNRKDFKGSPVEQAFVYAHKVGSDCQWVIVSNFLEIRLYQANDINKYESFDILSLTLDHEFDRFYYLLANGQLFLRKQLSVVQYALENRLEEQQQISKEFYAKYKTLRELFVRHLITHNKNITPLKLLEFAQTIIDRIVFVSVIKDFELVSPKIIADVQNIANQSYINSETELWRQLKGLFNALDKGFPPRIHKFNGGLFKHNPAIDSLEVKDNFIKHLLKLSEYDFESDLSINILGHIFEQSITDIEKLREYIIANKLDEITENLDEIVENKVAEEANQRKKHGIFYTPEYITHYIVKECIGSWLDHKKDELGLHKIQDLPKSKKEQTRQIDQWNKYLDILGEITILDPACGSGAFLTQAYDYLYKEWQIVIDIITKLQGKLPKQAKVNGALNFDDNTLPNNLQDWVIRKNIVRKNLYGVDLNNESVEITKLGLWLKTATKRDSLAELENNIKCGNSLIADKEVAGDKAFDWNNEFKTIIENGGFDIVIGNPPYVFAREKISNEDKNYYAANYETSQYQANTYVLFIEKAIKLTKNKSFWGLIVPNAWLMVSSTSNLRKFILENTKVDKIINLLGYSFEDVNVETIIIKGQKTIEPDNEIKIFGNNGESFEIQYSRKQNDFLKNDLFEFKIFADYTSKLLTEKIKSNTVILDEIVEIKAGLQAYEVGKGTPAQSSLDVENRPYDFDYQFDENTYPYLEGKDVCRYSISWSGQYLQYGNQLAAPRTINIFKNNNLIVREITGIYPNCLFATYSDELYLFNRSNIAILEKDKTISLKYILALLNSKLMSFYFINNTAKAVRKMFPKIILKDLRRFPIKRISETEQQPFIKQVDDLLALWKEVIKRKKDFTEIIKVKLNVGKLNTKIENWTELEFNEFHSELEKIAKKIAPKQTKEWKEFFTDETEEIKPLIQKINRIDRKLDKMVYKLYDLTDEEIDTVEKK